MRRPIANTVATIWVIAGLAGAARAEPLRIGVLTWVGNGPLFVAREKGLFAREGVEIELIDMAIHEASYAGLFAGQVDVISVTVDDMLPNFDPEQPYACVLAIDESLGGDGIIANNDIRSIADLRGKAVAFPKRAVSEFFLNVLLKNAGLSEADIEPVEMSFDDAANAFLMREVDAAVTSEPWLTYGEQSEHGHLLAESSETPGLIVDCLVARTDVLDARLPEFKALARAWDAALAYVAAHPDEANAIMARSVGAWLEDPAVFAETLNGIRFYDSARNREYFGTPDRPGQIYQTSQYAIDFWSSLGVLDVPLTPADVIRHDLWGRVGRRGRWFGLTAGFRRYPSRGCCGSAVGPCGV
jgi:NitT/TauT family transport system substrate-binding protein